MSRICSIPNLSPVIHSDSELLQHFIFRQKAKKVACSWIFCSTTAPPPPPPPFIFLVGRFPLKYLIWPLCFQKQQVPNSPLWVANLIRSRISNYFSSQTEKIKTWVIIVRSSHFRLLPFCFADLKVLYTLDFWHLTLSKKLSAFGLWDHLGNLFVFCLEDAGILGGAESLETRGAADLGNISAQEDKWLDHMP